MTGSVLHRQSRRVAIMACSYAVRVQCPYQASRAFMQSSIPAADQQSRDKSRRPHTSSASRKNQPHRSQKSPRTQNLPASSPSLDLSVATADQLQFNPNDPRQGHPVPLLDRIRVVPDSPSYFSARPNFTDDFLRVESLYLKWKILPRTASPPDILWHSFDEAKAMTGNEPVLIKRYRQLIRMLKDMSAIEPALMPTDVRDLLESHKRSFQPSSVKAKLFDVDEWGRSLGVGKRKSSTARAYLVMGEGEVLVNGKTLTQKFARLHDRESAMWPLKIADRLDKYNVFAIVSGGGTTGQAEALTLAVAKALLVHEPKLEERLLQTGMLYRDPRVVERKKPGHLKARKMPAWVKR